jgi:4-aminobutyrate aminotransferase-like enzyme
MSFSPPGQTPPSVDIISINSYSAADEAGLDAETRSLVERRERVMGPAYRLFYSNPFQPVRATGTKIYDVHGHEYLDAYNNVASVGHNHPRVVDAVARQLRLINTNTRYLQRDIIEYAEDLVSVHDPALENVMFTCTGSEANDLAARMARQVTGGTGIIVSDYAYHGCTRDVASWSPSSGVGTVLGSDVRTVAPPDAFRRPSHDLAQWFATQVQAQIDDLKRHGVKLAALIVDSLFSSDGIHPDAGALAPAIDAVHAAGGLCILDEVQAGFARTGDDMWGYQRSGITPDIVTMGKPMGNGMPIGGVVTKRSVMTEFGRNIAYFNTFGGENAPVAAAQAVLDVIREEGLLANAQDKGAQLRRGMRRVLDDNGIQADVRGAGLYLGVEFVTDLADKIPDPKTTVAFVNELRNRRVITSMAGQFGNVIKMRPPLVFDQSDVDRFLTEFENVARQFATGKINLPTSSDVEEYQLDDLRRMIAEELRDLIGSANGGY